MKSERHTSRGGLWWVLGVSVAVVCAAMLAIVLLTVRYQAKNQDTYEALITTSLEETHWACMGGIARSINELVGVVQSAADTWSTLPNSQEDEISPGSWKEALLDTIRSLERVQDADHFTLAELNRELARQDATDSAISRVNTVLQGQTAVSDLMTIQFGSRQRDVVAVAAPVLSRGQVIGAIRVVAWAERLFPLTSAKNGSGVMHFLVNQEGDLLYGKGGRLAEGSNLLEHMRTQGTTQEDLALVEGALRLDTAETVISLEDTGDGAGLLILSPLGYNGWWLLSVARRDAMSGTSAQVTRNTTLLFGQVLVVLLVMAALVLAGLLLQRRWWKENQAQYDLLAQFSDTVLFLYRDKTKRLSFTPNVRNRFAMYQIHEIPVFDRDYACQVLCPDDLHLLREALREVVQQDGPDSKTVMLRLRCLDQEYRWMCCQCYGQEDRKGRRGTVVGKLYDVNEQTIREQILLDKSSTDSLTGALNRRAMEAEISTLLGGGHPGYFYLVDVDNFKGINDRNGHAVGDRVLIELVEVLRTVFRQDDVIGRLGGDEFVVYLQNVGEREVAIQKAEQLLTAFRGRLDVPVSVSVGIAPFPQAGKTYEELYQAADAAMYHGKRAGKNRWSFGDAPSQAEAAPLAGVAGDEHGPHQG